MINEWGGNNSLLIAAEPDNTGNPQQGSPFFLGSVAVSRLYNRALSQEEITQNFNATKDRFGL